MLQNIGAPPINIQKDLVKNYGTSFPNLLERAGINQSQYRTVLDQFIAWKSTTPSEEKSEEDEGDRKIMALFAEIGSTLPDVENLNRMIPVLVEQIKRDARSPMRVLKKNLSTFVQSVPPTSQTILTTTAQNTLSFALLLSVVTAIISGVVVK
jgi:hypothetical protein